VLTVEDAPSGQGKETRSMNALNVELKRLIRDYKETLGHLNNRPRYADLWAAYHTWQEAALALAKFVYEQRARLVIVSDPLPRVPPYPGVVTNAPQAYSVPHMNKAAEQERDG
jgi:hypothetical protein